MSDPMWDPDYQGCKMSGLPYNQCGCPTHAPGASLEPLEGTQEAPRVPGVHLGTCPTCQEPLEAGDTFEGVFCSWLCSLS